MSTDNILKNDAEKNHDEEIYAFVRSLKNDIIDEDILKGIKGLKTENAWGIDLIYKEYIKSSCDVLLPLHSKLLNVILDTGVVSESWLIGQIIPIFQNKGRLDDHKNYI